MLFAHFDYLPELKVQCMPVIKELTVLNKEVTDVDLSIINQYLNFSLKKKPVFFFFHGIFACYS